MIECIYSNVDVHSYRILAERVQRMHQLVQSEAAWKKNKYKHDWMNVCVYVSFNVYMDVKKRYVCMYEQSYWPW